MCLKPIKSSNGVTLFHPTNVEPNYLSNCSLFQIMQIGSANLQVIKYIVTPKYRLGRVCNIKDKKVFIISIFNDHSMHNDTSIHDIDRIGSTPQFGGVCNH